MEVPPSSQPDEIDLFFSQYPTFQYQREKPVYAEFYRMCDAFGWHKQSDGTYPQERENAQSALRISMVQAFNSTFGPDVEDLEGWRRICYCLRLSPMPTTVGQAQQVVKQIHVNLVDLLESVRTGSPAEHFATIEDLRQYTVAKGKFFPKEEAYEGGLLRFLLREILHEYNGPGARQRLRNTRRNNIRRRRL